MRKLFGKNMLSQHDVNVFIGGFFCDPGEVIPAVLLLVIPAFVPCTSFLRKSNSP